MSLDFFLENGTTLKWSYVSGVVEMITPVFALRLMIVFHGDEVHVTHNTLTLFSHTEACAVLSDRATHTNKTRISCLSCFSLHPAVAVWSAGISPDSHEEETGEISAPAVMGMCRFWFQCYRFSASDCNITYLGFSRQVAHMTQCMLIFTHWCCFNKEPCAVFVCWSHSTWIKESFSLISCLSCFYAAGCQLEKKRLIWSVGKDQRKKGQNNISKAGNSAAPAIGS